MLAAALKPLLAIAAVLGALAGLIFTATVAIDRIYAAGQHAGRAEIQARLDQAQADARVAQAEHLAKLAGIGRALQDQEADANRRVAEAAAKRRRAETKLKEALHANPTFGALERPDDLRRLRRAELAGLAQAAQRGAELSGPGLGSLPAAGDRGRLEAGELGGDRPAQPLGVADLRAGPQ